MTDAVAIDGAIEAFCDEVREFLAARLPAWLRDKVLRHETLVKSDYLAWQAILLERGWMCWTWPARFGGPEFSAMQAHVFEEECWLAGAPDVLPFGHKMLGPLIMRYGAPAQQSELLPRILRSEDWWCQGYSEPGAGSDLASLGMRAELRGDHFVVNGQKTWTSYGQYANRMFCLVRTDPSAAPQAGISFLLLDMDTPGIEVRPIRLLDGSVEVNEVFLQDVVVPAGNLLGELNKGWDCAKYLLGHERLNVARIGRSKRELRLLRRLAARPDADGFTLLRDPHFAERIARAECELHAVEQFTLRLLSEATAGRAIGPEASILKLVGTDLAQQISSLLVDTLGPRMMGFDGSTPASVPDEPAAGDLVGQYMNWRKLSIYGGSNEVQRNIIAKAVLGL